ncbi:MAG: hypothetical protein PHG98_02945 [Bacteroidales bacterium]|nr:hypothetical protein [Bacteroidales bacterium]MDD4738887.1 hypothetical protein [Bacteroidales bacterium]
MKKLLFILFCSISFFTNAQSIDELITQTEKNLSIYEQISPWKDDYLVSYFDLSKEELIDEEGKEIEENGIIDQFLVQHIYQKRILKNIDEIVNHKDFPGKGSDLFSASPDNKLFNFVMDENTGGTYRSRLSVIYYKENGTIVFREERGKEEEEDSSNYFNPDGYSIIDTIQTQGQVKYFLQGNVFGCTTCSDDYIKLIHFENSIPVIDFEYTLYTRMGSVKQFDYNSKDKTITIEYNEDDLNGEYNYDKDCGDYHFEIYKFNGKTFKSIEKRVEKCAKE